MSHGAVPRARLEGPRSHEEEALELKVPPGYLLEEILWLVPAQAIRSALAAGGVPSLGRKGALIARLVDAGRASGVPAGEVLGLFKAEALRRLCTTVGVRAATKEDMVHRLVATLMADEQILSRIGTNRHSPTREAVLEILRGSALPAWVARDEAAAEQSIGFLLRKVFSGVSHQVGVGGFVGDRIDIDLGGGAVGVEVKLAKALNESASEAYRGIGQAVIYQRVQYSESLVVAIVGMRNEFGDTPAAAVATLLDELGVGVAIMITG